jgi:hypothetical protein
MKTVKSNVRSSLCQRKGLIFMQFSTRREGLGMGEFPVAIADLEGYAGTCN